MVAHADAGCNQDPARRFVNTASGLPAAAATILRRRMRFEPHFTGDGRQGILVRQVDFKEIADGREAEFRFADRPPSSGRLVRTSSRMASQARGQIRPQTSRGVNSRRFSRRATACKAPRHRWHLRQSWRCRICNLQNLKSPVRFESHPLRQLLRSRSIVAGSGVLIGHRATRF